MGAHTPQRARERLVWFSPYLLAVALSPAVLQPLSCSKTGDTTLSSLEFEVEGTNEIAFHSTLRSYDVSLPGSASSAIVRATSTDPAARVSYDLRDSGGPIEAGSLGIGGGEVSLDLPLGQSSLNISVRAPGGASGIYSLNINVACGQCDDGNECTSDDCDTTVEMCVHSPIPDGTQCDLDGSPGVCIGGTCNEPVAACTDLTAGSCEDPNLSCQCCPIGGPAQRCLCSTPCSADDQCTDPSRPVCNKPESNGALLGFCAPAGFVCCWLCV